MGKLSVGKFGEGLAAEFLAQKGYQIIERNFRKRYGEIDLVAREGKTLVFIEVKTRLTDKYGLPEEAITPWKLKALVRSANYYKMLHPELPELLRIDLVAIDYVNSSDHPEIRLIKNISG
ncbi:YraN family protein [Candidatus Shapirobacteria bacterium]|nr:YraN family protein [Candidatus Shapirobacteria bacterium]